VAALVTGGGAVWAPATIEAEQGTVIIAGNDVVVSLSGPIARLTLDPAIFGQTDTRT
jgi:hypothetical protein